MRFGVQMNLQAPNLEAPESIIERAIEIAQAADELGFHSVWLTEHHFSSYCYCPQPLMSLIKIATLTSRIRVGTSILVVPLHHPLQLAEDIAMADVLTNGRLEVGFGPGYQPYEFARLGQHLDDSRSRYEEGLDIITEALTREPISHQGEHYQFPKTHIFPKLIQKPHPPYWIAAQSEDSVRMAIRRGMNILTGGSRAAQAVAFWKLMEQIVAEEQLPSRPLFALQRYVYVGDSDAEVRNKVDAVRWHVRVATHLRQGTERVDTGGRAVAEPITNEIDDETFFRDGGFLGAPDTVIGRVKDWHAQVPFDHLNCSLWAGDMTHQEVLASMQRFAREVMPELKAL